MFLDFFFGGWFCVCVCVCVQCHVGRKVGMRSRIKFFPTPFFVFVFLYPNGKWMRNNF